MGNCKGQKVCLNKLFEKFKPIILFQVEPVFGLNLKFSIGAYSGLWETSSLRAVVHDGPKGALGPSLAVATGVCCGQLQGLKSLFEQTF